MATLLLLVPLCHFATLPLCLATDAAAGSVPAIRCRNACRQPCPRASAFLSRAHPLIHWSQTKSCQASLLCNLHMRILLMLHDLQDGALCASLKLGQLLLNVALQVPVGLFRCNIDQRVLHIKASTVSRHPSMGQRNTGAWPQQQTCKDALRPPPPYHALMDRMQDADTPSPAALPTLPLCSQLRTRTVN